MSDNSGEATPLLGIQVHRTPPAPGGSSSGSEDGDAGGTSKIVALKDSPMNTPSTRTLSGVAGKMRRLPTRRLNELGRMETVYSLNQATTSMYDILRTSIRIPMPGKNYVVRIYLHYWLWQIPILCLNIALFIVWYYTHYSAEPVIALTELGFLAVAPVMVAAIVRDNYFKWFVYWLVKKSPAVPCTTQATRYHLSRLADCIGGLHSSMGVSSFMWNTIYAIGAYLREDKDITSPRVLTAFALPFMLAMMCVVALPCFRHFLHNQFEVVHRYVGWLSLCVLTTHVLLVNIYQHNKFASMSGHTPSIFTAVLIFLTVYPWVIMYRIKSSDCEIYTAEKSVLIILPVWCRLGAVCKLSYDWVEFHILGITPITQADDDRSLILIQDLGDWTHNIVEMCKNGTPPPTLYLHRIFAPNFTQGLFNWRKVFIIVTGSGLAPILPYVINPVEGLDEVKLTWVARAHEKNYPPKLFELLANLPPDMVELYDTTLKPRPNLGELALDGALDMGAEAVFVVSRASLAYEVCDFCVRNGMPAFGSNFDV